MFEADTSGLRKLAADIKKLDSTVEVDSSTTDSEQVDQVVRHFKKTGLDMDRSEAGRILRDATRKDGPPR